MALSGWTLRALAVASALCAVVALALVESANDTGRVDQAGVVLVAVVAGALLFVAYELWRRGATRIAVAAAPLPTAGRDLAVQPVRRPEHGDVDAIVLDRVTVRYGVRVALRDVSFRVGRGEVVALLGPNGAGKTTTVDVCCGLRAPVTGSASVFGYDATRSGPALRRSIGVVPQDTGLYPELTASEYLHLFAAMYAVPNAAARVDELLELMGLRERSTSRINGFSGGMKRRLALSRALLHDPPVLFLDEPTLGVDVHGRRVLWEHVSRLRDEGRSVLLTTNYLEEATALCDRVVILDEGAVLADERPDTLRRQSGTTLLLEVDGDASAVAAAVAEQCDVSASTTDGPVSVSLPRDDLAAAVIQVASKIAAVTSVRTEQPTLEEVFLRLTGRGLRE